MRVGIDLGTTFSVAGYCDENGLPHVIINRDGTNSTPSVVMFDEGEVIVGQQAKDNASLDPANVCQFVKRWMGNKDFIFETNEGEEYSAEDISARILKRICEDCESVLNEKITEAVITVPAYFSDAQRQATIDAGRIAGLNVLAVINEPTAAALAYGIGQDQSQNQRVMVYDLGGGTFDVTIIEIAEGKVNVLATHGNRNLGGFDFDNKLVTYFSEEFKKETQIDIEEDDDAYQALRTNCEKAKIALSSRSNYQISVSAEHCKPVKLKVTREQFEEMIYPIIIETEVSVDIALEDSGLVPRDIDKVLLVGGSTRIPAVREFIEKKMNMRPSCEMNPDEAVALGAAIYASKFTEKGSDFSETKKSKNCLDETELYPAEKETPEIIQDVNSHSLGIVANNDMGIAVNNIIIPRNQPIPALAFRDFATVIDDQEQVELQVTEGDDEDLAYVQIIGTAEIQLRPHPANSPVRVELGYDSNGIVTGRVFDLVDDVYCGEIVIKREANMSEEELQDKAKRIRGEQLQ